MIVISMEAAPVAIRGELSRWFIEIKPNVFVGNVNARIRDLLWVRLCDNDKVKGALLIYSTNSEQGYEIRVTGDHSRKVIDFDGIKLLSTKIKI